MTTEPAPQDDAGGVVVSSPEDAALPSPPSVVPIDAATPEDTGPACASTCAPPSARCEAGGVSLCAIDADGCAAWGPPVACAASLSCVTDGEEASCVAIDPARPIAPLSTATSTSRRPLFRWALADGTDGARVDVCRDRACKTILLSFDATGSSGVAPTPLLPGVYYWRVRGALGGVAGKKTSVVWELVVGARSAAVSTSWGSMLDVNGDGFADVAVGVPFLNSLGGEIQVFLGGASGLATTPTTYPDPGDDGGAAEIGYVVRSAGDVNGDGFADLIAGAPGAGASPGAAYLYLGGPTGLSSTPMKIPGPAGKLYFGSSVDGAGDVNGDGYADVVIAGWVAGRYAPGAYLYLGSASGLATTAISLSAPGSIAQLASAGDVNGDGFGDVVLGDFTSGGWTGAAYLYLGNGSGLAAPVAIPSPLGAYAMLGYSAGCAGDVNGDGYADVVLGAPGEVPSVLVYEGGPAGLSAIPTTLPNPTSAQISLSFPSSEFGMSVASAGDLNGDGFADVVVGAPIVASYAGAAYVYFGSASGLSTTPVTLAGDTGGLGESVAGAGDVNGDGLGDLLAGAPYGTGAAYLYLGEVSGAPRLATTLLGPGPRGEFGYSLR